MKLTENNIKTFRQNHIICLQNIIPNNVAEKIRHEFDTSDFDLISQKRTHYYERVFNNQIKLSPTNEEEYSSLFYRSAFLEKKEIIRETYLSFIKPILDKLSGFDLSKHDLRAYKMGKGGHFRTHIDDYAGNLGFIWYLSKNWKWDWGGLLCYIDDDQLNVNLPKWNQLIVFDHQKGKIPHFVTSVEDFAKDQRIMLAGFVE